MTTILQYDLFEEVNNTTLQQKEIDTISQQLNNLRRGLFQRHSEMGKLIMKQQQEIDQLRSMIMEIRNK